MLTLQNRSRLRILTFQLRNHGYTIRLVQLKPGGEERILFCPAIDEIIVGST